MAISGNMLNLYSFYVHFENCIRLISIFLHINFTELLYIFGYTQNLLSYFHYCTGTKYI